MGNKCILNYLINALYLNLLLFAREKVVLRIIFSSYYPFTIRAFYPS